MREPDDTNGAADIPQERSREPCRVGPHHPSRQLEPDAPGPADPNSMEQLTLLEKLDAYAEGLPRPDGEAIPIAVVCADAAATIRDLQVDVTDRDLMTAQGLLLEAAFDLKDVASENTRLMLVGVQGLLHVVQRKLWKQEEALAEAEKRAVPEGFEWCVVSNGHADIIRVSDSEEFKASDLSGSFGEEDVVNWTVMAARDADDLGGYEHLVQAVDRANRYADAIRAAQEADHADA